MAAELATLLSMAQAAGLHVQLTLFDQFGNYTQIAQSQEFVEDLLTPYENDPEIVFVELQNEIDFTNSQAMTWARALLPTLQSTIGSIPATISVPGDTGVAGLAALITALGSSQPEIYDFHYYGATGEAATTFAAAKALVAPAPLFIGEAGMSTLSSGSAADSESLQANYFYNVDGAAESLGLPFAAPWTFYDFTPTALLPGMPADQMYFGLYHTDGTPKPAAAVVSQFFLNGQQPPVQNPSFETVSAGVPTGWVPVNTANGTLAVSTTVAHTGTNSVSISGSTGPQDAQPAWTQVANTGVLTAGQNFQGTVWAEGSAATGQNVISIAWFGSANNYLGNATSATLPAGTSTWTELGVNATVPSGAAYAVIYLQSTGNTGTVFFDDVSLTDLGTNAFPALPTVGVTSGQGPTVQNLGLDHFGIRGDNAGDHDIAGK
jgi:hypothetical protein